MLSQQPQLESVSPARNVQPYRPPSHGHPNHAIPRDFPSEEIAGLGEMGQDKLQKILLSRDKDYLIQRVNLWPPEIFAIDCSHVWEETGPPEAT
jgi:hypothetical protein